MSLPPTPPLKQRIKQYPAITLVIAGVLILFVLWLLFSSPASFTPSEDYTAERPQLETLQEAIDPRELWSDRLQGSLNQLENNLQQTLQQFMDQQQHHNQSLEQRLDALESKTEPPRIDTSVRLTPQSLPSLPKPQPQLLHLHLDPPARPEKKAEKNKTPAIAHAQAVLLTGTVVSTAVSSASAPEPLVLRLVSPASFSQGYTTEQIEHAELLASCHGDLSKERAVCRLETLSMKNNRGELLEETVEGWIFGEDGRQGLKGDVVDKSSEVARMAILNGILGGMANFFQNQSQSGLYPISPFSGPRHALKGEDALKAGGASGVGNALSKLADYAIKRAEQMSPVIVVGSGRVVDVVFKKSVPLLKSQKKESALLSLASKEEKAALDATVKNNASFSGISAADTSCPTCTSQTADITPDYRDFLATLQSKQSSAEGL